MAGKIAPRPSSPLSRSVDEGDGAVDRALARCAWGTAARPRAAHGRRRGRTRTTTRFCCGAFGAGPTVAGGSRNSSSMRTPLRVARPRLHRHQHQQRHDHGARPVGDLVEMERKPVRQQHDLDRHHRHGAPRNDAEQRQQDAREDVGACGAAAREQRLARAAHVSASMAIADHLQREIGLHGRADVESRRRGTAASRRARPGCGADRRAILASSAASTGSPR